MNFYNKLIVTVVSAGFFFGALPYAAAMNEEDESKKIFIKPTQGYSDLVYVPIESLLVKIVPGYWFFLKFPKDSIMTFEEFVKKMRKNAAREFSDQVKGKKIVSVSLHGGEPLNQSNFPNQVKQFKNNFIEIMLERDEELTRKAKIKDIKREKENNFEIMAELIQQFHRLKQRNKALDEELTILRLENKIIEKK